MKNFVVYIVLVVALLLSATTTKSGVKVELMGNVTIDSLPDGTRFLYQTEQLSYADTAGDFPIIVHEQLKKQLGAADWTIVAFSGGNTILLKEVEGEGFIYTHLLTSSVAKVPYENFWIIIQKMIENEVALGETINAALDAKDIGRLSLYYQVKKEGNEMAQFVN